jgi:hypothetical protein
MFKHWRAIVGILFFLQPAWQFIKWGLDWAGRIDLITSHLRDFGVQAVLSTAPQRGRFCRVWA